MGYTPMELAVATGLEPASSSVTGKHFLQLNYITVVWWVHAEPEGTRLPPYILERLRY